MLPLLSSSSSHRLVTFQPSVGILCAKNSGTQVHVVDPLFNHVQQPDATLFEPTHQAGLVFVAMDAMVFPDQPLARLSDHVRLMKSTQSGDMNGAPARSGLTMATYGAVAGAWITRMATDPILMLKFSTMMVQS